MAYPYRFRDPPGAIRTRPILLTAAALMVGAFVIILDPIFQGLAVSLLFGVGASTLLTLVVIPVLYYYLMGKSAGPNHAAGNEVQDNRDVYLTTNLLERFLPN